MSLPLPSRVPPPPPTPPARAAVGDASARLGTPAAAGRRTAEATITSIDFEALDDAELIRRARQRPESAAAPLDALFRRHQRRVATWCLRWCHGRSEDAADLAQEVFLRAQEKLEGFRFQSAFTTWLYLVTRTVALNRADAARRRPSESLEEHAIDPADPAPAADEALDAEWRVGQLRAAIATALEPLEARVLYLHFHEGLTLPAIDGLLGLTNKSGARAFLVAARRKLRRHFDANSPTTGGDAAEEAP